MIKTHLKALCFLTALFYVGSAHAQEKSFLGDFESEPMAYKGFLISPAIETKLLYDDNVLVLEEDETADMAVSVEPELTVKKEFGRHFVLFNTQGQVKRYKSESKENVINGSAKLEGYFEAYRGLTIPVEIRYSKYHMERINRTPGSLTDKPQGLSDFLISTGFMHQPNRLRTEFTSFYKQFRAEDTTNRVSGLITPGEDKDTNTIGADVQITYDTGRWWKPRLNLTFESEDDIKRTFIRGSGFNGDERDNNLYRGLVGLEVDYKDMVRGSVDVGYEHREYTADDIESITGLSVAADLALRLTPRTEIGFEAARKTSEDNEILAGITRTSAKLGIQQELNSRMFLEGSLGYSFSEFAESDREDDEYRFSLGTLYLIKKGLFLEGRYTHAKRESTQTGLSYDRNLFLLNLRHEF